MQSLQQLSSFIFELEVISKFILTSLRFIYFFEINQLELFQHFVFFELIP
jgi:hypothetical protein